ncbi:serine/threonine protein kinase [Sulfolobus sp. SCGC AB-777_L09]|nr:serine/threonine protein kinase [Sulfolobus sp. SCGC AB-777_L09]
MPMYAYIIGKVQFPNPPSLTPYVQITTDHFNVNNEPLECELMLIDEKLNVEITYTTCLTIRETDSVKVFMNNLNPKITSRLLSQTTFIVIIKIWSLLLNLDLSDVRQSLVYFNNNTLIYNFNNIYYILKYSNFINPIDLQTAFKLLNYLMTKSSYELSRDTEFSNIIQTLFISQRALGYGIPRRISGNYQNQPPQPTPQSNPQTPYQPNLPQTPSRPLMGRSLSNWDPNVWINRTLSVYEIEKVIGEGGNGYVLKGEYSGKPLAIKVLKLYGGSPEEFFSDLATEASNLVNLSNHKNIVKIYAVNVDTFVIDSILNGRTDLYVKNPPMIVMEYMGGGTLKDLLGEDLFYYSSKWQRNVLRAICGVAEALGYIHSQGFVHMDVKPQNIFLSERPKDPSELDKVTFKLGDLGSAVRINGKVKQITPEYSPPEVFQEPAKPHFDIYALGMTAYVLLTRKMDRPDLNEMNNAIDCYIKRDTNCVRSEVDKARTKLMYWNVNVDPEIDPLLKSMLSIEPLRRPTAREVVDMIKKINPTICS